jgi:hypothetical protein
VTENLCRDAWADLDQADLRILLMERIGGPGQRDGDPNILHLPLARDQCRVSLTFMGSQITAIRAGAAFDAAQWESISSEIDALLDGPRKVGREFSFSTFRVNGSWRGTRSGVQILPAPCGAAQAPVEIADHAFILEFPIKEVSLWPITNHRRIREHRRLTLLLNVLLAGTTTYLTEERSRHFWGSVWSAGKPQSMWVQESYFAELGSPVADQLSAESAEKLEELEPERYYAQVGHDGRGLRLPSDLDDAICRYQAVPPKLRARFDLAAYWMSMASRQWEYSMSASFTSLVSAAEALTKRGTQHRVHCPECGKTVPHDAPGPTAQFRTLFETYASGPALTGNRSKMYDLRSKLSHGNQLMLLDQGRAFGWDPPWWNERELHSDLWRLMQVTARNWLKAPPAE